MWELGRVCLGRKLYSFAFVFYLILFRFLIKNSFTPLNLKKNVYLPNLHRACSEHRTNSTGMHFLLNCQQQPGKWDCECQTREKRSPGRCLTGSKVPHLARGRLQQGKKFLQSGRKKMLLMQEKLQPLRPTDCVQETFVTSNMQFLTWNLTIMKNKYYSFSSPFLRGLEYLEGVWGRKAFVHLLQLSLRFEWGWCKTNKTT